MSSAEYPNTAEGNRAWVREAYRRRMPLAAMATELAVLAAILPAFPVNAAASSSVLPGKGEEGR